MSTAIKDIFLTLHGQEVDGLSVAIGETVNWHLTLQDSTTLDPFNLAGANVVIALSKLDAHSNPVGAPIVARQADIVSDVDGTALAQWVAVDTYRTPKLVPGNYGLEVWLTDVDGNRLASMPVGRIRLTASSYAPAGDITPLPAQDPLAQGPAGIPIAAYATFGDFPDPTTVEGAFAYDLANNVLYVSENDDWQNTGTSIPSGSDGQFLGHVSGQPQYVTLTLDMIGAAFAVTLSGATSVLEAGASVVDPQFTDTHNQTPSVASLTGPDSVSHSISPATLTALGYGGVANTFPTQTFTDPGSTLNQVFAWTYSATSGGVTRTATSSTTFERRAYYDMVNVGTYNAAFITALGSSGLQAGFAGSYAFGAGDGVKYAHLAIPAAWGDPSTFKEHVSQLPVAWTKVASSVSVTNTNSVVISYNIWRAPQANTSAFTYDVS